MRRTGVLVRLQTLPIRAIMDRPTIFLSSTIYDFRDLRGALKDYLESQGCRVNASEFNDFDKPLDKHSYDACLSAIERSDFFVLLIGNRIGGWFDEANKVSITRAEYRHAYQLAQTGKLKLLTFVRDEVWNHRQSIKELKRALKSEADLSDEQRARLANHPTNFATEAETIISFIDEVSRNKETIAASREQGPMPVANWIHVFKNFGEVRQAIDLLILNGEAVDVAARRKALQSQLLTMLREIVPSISGKPLLPGATIRRIASTLNLKASDIARPVRVDGKTWGHFVMLASIASKPRPEIGHLRQLLTSDLLLRYEPATSTFRETEEYDLLAEVISAAANLGLSDGSGISDLLKHGQRINRQEDREVPGHILGAHLHRMFRLADLASSAKELALALGNQPFTRPVPMPRTPFVDQEQGVAEEEVSLEQIRAWVGLTS